MTLAGRAPPAEADGRFMELPELEHPERYAGLYVVDFGDTCAVGYTAEEVAVLLESERYAHVTVYRIHDAHPDGTLELRGVPRQRFQLEAGLFFHSRDLAAARRDFHTLRRLAEAEGMPCRAQLLLGVRQESARLRYVVGLAYPAEYDDDVARWMLDHHVTAGEYADGGIGRLDQMRRLLRVIDTAQLRAVPRAASRTREEVFAQVHRPIQRTA